MSRLDRPASGLLSSGKSLSRPGRVRVQWGRFIRNYPFYPSIPITLGIVGLLLMAYRPWMGYTFLGLAVIAASAVWFLIREWLASGDLSPGLVLQLNPPLVAVLTDISRAHQTAPAIKILPAPLSGSDRRPLAPGDRIAAVVLHRGRDVGERWSDIDAFVVSCVTNSDATISRSLDLFEPMEWDYLNAGLAQVPRPIKPSLTILKPDELLLDSHYSPSGAPIHRHTPRRFREFTPALGDEDQIRQIEEHIEDYVGPIDRTSHEMVSDLVHVDVHVVEPDEDRPFYTLITSGMSERPMTVPDGAEHCTHAELMICLPPDWEISQDAFEDERNYWPVRWLRILARYPHEYETWLFDGHSVPNGDPPAPFARTTDLCCFLLVTPVVFEEEFSQLRLESGELVHFLQCIPLYASEMDFKLNAGYGALLERFREADLSPIIDPTRENVCL